MTEAEFLVTLGLMLGSLAVVGIVHSRYNLRRTRELVAKERRMREVLRNIDDLFPADGHLMPTERSLES